MCIHIYSHNLLSKLIAIKMANLTLSIPDDLKKRMEEFPEINWSEVARDSIKKKIAQLNFLKNFRIDSEISPEDALTLGRKMNELLLKHYKNE